jgi:predicted N-formylglutamate amidohydrolase
MKPVYERYDSHEVYGFSGPGPLLLVCEHASNRVPAPLRTTATDRDWLATHWGWDIGIRSVCREVIRQSQSIGIFARFSRLICDANRAPDHHHLVRCAVEGQVLSFNNRLTIDEVDRRLLKYHAAYHAAVDLAVAERMKHQGDVLLMAMHSFTPQLGEEKRWMDVGVLFDPFEPIARRLQAELDEEGLKVALNEPYSAKDGLMYAATRHGSAHGAVYLELEINQKLISTPGDALKMGRTLARAFSRLHVRGTKQSA